ncbi:hypothetical protein DFQ27_001633 [Actinomortierella ambigua]|uniref:Uncharacterized protein n=1 Tax=Actinomortierella ambigua TaxID=1343610 RepID=A0A9P6QBK6_9FUNG|nr:hypothetical protein DFQ27_001633 [Actinomortierella ambigua]
MSQQSRRLPFALRAREPEYIRIEEDEVQDQVRQPKDNGLPQLCNVAKGDPMKRRPDGSFSKAEVLNSLVPIHHAKWGGYTPKEIPPKKKSTARSSSLPSSASSSSSSSSSAATNTRTTADSRGGAFSFSFSFSSRVSASARPSTART